MSDAARSSFAALTRLARHPPAAERCELCAADLRDDHDHLIEPASRRILCSCDACACLFERRGPGGRYRRLPRRVEFWPDFRLDDAAWEGLRLPIDLAFFFRSTPRGRVIALFPSPAGATECLLEFATWRDLVRDNPRLEGLEPDVEALLVNRLGPARECYRAPIDECFRLVGLVRAKWKGLSGGTEVRKAIVRFFEGLKARAGRPGRTVP